MKDKKHAYLIIGHEDNLVLEILIELLDNPQNDIFIHIDKKTSNFNFEKYQKNIKYSKLYFIPRIKIYWGGFSQILAEINLMKFAFNNDGNYRYYHLLSGVDLPLKSQKEIHSFFKKNDGKEFVGISKDEVNFQDRVGRYYIEQLKTRNIQNKYLKKINKGFEKIQKILKIERNKSLIEEGIYKGSQWFSITNNLVEYILKNEKKIKKIFWCSYCCDEIFLQTLIMKSIFKENIFLKSNTNDNKASLRYIDWNRGNPYIFKEEDYEALINSECLFARKFSEKIDRKIIIKLRDKILEGEKDVRGI